MDIQIKKRLSDDIEEIDSEFIPMISENEEDQHLQQTDLPDTLPILPLRNMVLFSGVVMPVTIGRNKSLRLVRETYQKESLLAVFTQIDANVDDPGVKDLYPNGLVARIIRILEMPDNTTTVIIQGMKRCLLEELVSTEPYLRGRVKIIEETPYIKEDREFEALIQAIKELSIKIIKNSGNMPQEATFAIRNIEQPFALVNFICSNFAFKLQDKLSLLKMNDFKDRCYKLLEIMTKESQLLELKVSIQSKAREDINQQQREYFLQQQIKTIQDELGGNTQEQDAKDMRDKASKKKWSEQTGEIFEKELEKLERTSPHSPDYSTQLNYLTYLLDLPWNEYSKDNFNLKRAKKVLDRDHYGLEKVKERILEHLAVLKLKGDMKSPIICLYGPPGVGKTSLGKSVAEALSRKYVRVSLGGMHDEAEIRGHRRTYIGAMPGRIIQSIIKAGTSNPVFILDEIDKLGNDFRGDPSSALLEVLDPEQNSAFHDNFIDIDFDLSKVLFIATANNLSTVSAPLRDRMEIIDISGYLAEEKVEIASRHLIPKEMDNHGIHADKLQINKPAIKEIIESYTRESGVRELDKKIAKIMRKVASKVAKDDNFTETITPEKVKDYLGMVEFTRDRYQGNEYAGVVTGLAWTSVGGEILFIESSLSKGKAGKLTLTGNLGDVMKESAVIALEYIKAHASQIGIEDSIFENWNVHIHVPEGAIPKDGPSAGVTMVTSLVSSFTQRKVRKNLAMTGEITLRGRVLPVGGIKEKILAAKRADIKEIILCEENRKDIEDIKDIYIKGLTFHFVKDIKEVLKYALLDELVDNPVNLKVEEKENSES
ncbi:MAG: endopeptidase La [Bacteroidales bacterium]|nr:endopeptidase La [Bacteroidales bacterium]MDD4711995.1 endopeptidase La [Bacteroidales bacterium]